ncbi:MAG: hypothetical protein O6940_07500 [Ignavibacteria bacterium]|nr:hypothetical protein [Ignavibacteria bacterium]
MTNKFLYLIIFIALIAISCDDGFDPFGEFQDNYALTCILKSDTTFQSATLSHNYRGDGFDPYGNTDDPSIIGADIRVWLGDSVYIFRDTSVARIDTSRYTTSFYFYYNNKFKIEPDKNLEIEVLLQNGQRLKASSRAPEEIFFDNESAVLIPSVNSELVKFIWNQQVEGTFYSPQLTIRYVQNINGNSIEKLKIVPIKYVEQNGDLVPLFPQPLNKTTIIYELDAVSRALEEISEGDPNKDNYTILQSPAFELIALDLNLSRYVSSTNQSLDDLTVTVNESDFTNVEGGLGVFGSYTKKNYTRIRFQPNYIESFGYNFLFDN